LWLHSLKVAQLLRSAACLHTNQSRSYLNHLVCVCVCVCVCVMARSTNTAAHAMYLRGKTSRREGRAQALTKYTAWILMDI